MHDIELGEYTSFTSKFDFCSTYVTNNYVVSASTVCICVFMITLEFVLGDDFPEAFSLESGELELEG